MPEIQAALTALGHRPHRPERQAVDLTGLHLAGARVGFADLTRARLDGANLTGARLDGANLTGAWLSYADLTGAWLGANPSVVPPGWVINDSLTGELRRAAA